MKLNILKKTKDSVTIEVKGESKTFVNLLKDELWKDKNILEAAAIKEHPYMGEPKLLVKVKTGNPITAITKAVRHLQVRAKEIRDEFNRDIKD